MILLLISSPTVNSVKTMNLSCFKRITREINRGWNLIEESTKKSNISLKKLLTTLCEPSDFFLLYPIYFSCTVSATLTNFNEL